MRIPGVKQFSLVTTLLAGAVVHEATNNAPAQEKPASNTPVPVAQAPKGYITTVNKEDGTKIIEESDAMGFLFKRTTEKLIEKGNVKETTVEDFQKGTGLFFKEVTMMHKNGLSEKYQSFRNDILTYFHLTTRYENKKVKEQVNERYDDNGFLDSRDVTKISKDGKKTNIESTDGFGVLFSKQDIEESNDGYNFEQNVYNKGVFARKIIKTGFNVSKIKSSPPKGNNPKNQKKTEMLISEITKTYDGFGNYEGKGITKQSTDNLIEIYESYDTSNKIYEKITVLREYRKDKLGKYSEYPDTAKRIEEEINKNGVCIHKNETQYREDDSKKVIDEIFSDKGKLQRRKTKDEILIQELREVRIEEFDENGKKTKDEKTVEPIK